MQRVARLAADEHRRGYSKHHRNGIKYSRDQRSYILDGVVVQDVRRGLRTVGEVASCTEEDAE